MPLLIVFVGLALFVLLIAYFKINPFLAFIIISIGIGIASGLEPGSISSSIQKGIGDILGSLVIILGFGAMLGKIIAESGAARRIAESLIQLFGPGGIQWGVVLTGFIVGIPLFFSVGFVILVPLVFTLSATARLPVIFLGIPLLAALSITHGLLPPHPAPTAIASSFEADMGLVLLYGMLVGIPAILIGGPLFARTVKNVESKPLAIFYESHQESSAKQPSLALSLINSLLPVILLTLPSFVPSGLDKASSAVQFILFLGDPVMAMLISVLVAVLTLGLGTGMSMTRVMEHCTEAVKGIAMVLLIIGGAGALKEVMIVGGVSPYVAGLLEGLDISPLVLAWLMAAAIRIAVGSATVAAMTTVGVVMPLIENSEVDPNLMVLSIGAGSLFFSHFNDGGFWLVKEYFNLTIKQTLRTWSTMEVVVSVVGLVGVLILNQFI